MTIMRNQDLLDPAALQQAVADLPLWQLDATRGALTRQFRFASFAEAFGFMAEIALHAERHDHHPEWSNVYNRVTVTWTSHDVQGVSARDVALARLCDAAAARRLQPPAP